MDDTVDHTSKIRRPGVNLEAMTGVVGLLLGFLFVFVEYFLEFPYEIQSIWGLPVLGYLALCYGVGLAFISYMIRFELQFFIANHALMQQDSEELADTRVHLETGLNTLLTRSVRALLIFLFCFGLFLANLAAFTAAKLFYTVFSTMDALIMGVIGEPFMVFIYLAVMFVYQLVMIYPFTYTWNLWNIYSTSVTTLNTAST